MHLWSARLALICLVLIHLPCNPVDAGERLSMLDKQLEFDFESSREVPCAQCALGLPASTRGDSLCLSEKIKTKKELNKEKHDRWIAKDSKNKELKNRISRDWYRANKERARHTNREWYQKNKEARKEYDKKRREKNREKLVEASKRWYWENRKRAISTAGKWKKNNPEKLSLWIKNNIHKRREAVRKWGLRNREKTRLLVSKRRARLVNSDGYKYTTCEMVSMRWLMWGNKCWICGSNAEATDHVIPLKPNYRDRPGAHLPSNLRPICRHCNSKKLNNSPDLFKLKKDGK